MPCITVKSWDIKYYGVQLIYYVPEVLLQWDRHARDLFQSPPLVLDISAGEVHMVCFDLEMERCTRFTSVVDALRNCI